MSLHYDTHAWAQAEPTSRKVGWLSRAYRAIRDEWRMRQALHAVQSLDERTLMDIGLSFGGAEEAVRRGRVVRGRKL